MLYELILGISWAYASPNPGQWQGQSARQATAFNPRRVGTGHGGPARPRLGLVAGGAVGGDRSWRSHLCHFYGQSHRLLRRLLLAASMEWGARRDYRHGRNSRGGMGAAIGSSTGGRVRLAPWLATTQLAPGSCVGQFVGGGLGAHEPGCGLGDRRGGRHRRRHKRRRTGHLRRVAGAWSRDDLDTGQTTDPS
jgi:hypothetical protein